MDKNGYHMLEQLIELAEKKNCKLHFTNYGTDIAKRIQMLQ
jgi:anti-anti-sigma regulatory factor